MLEKLINDLGNEKGLHRLALVTTVSNQILNTFDQEFGEDDNAKNVAIDTMVELLQKHKTAQ